MDKYKTAIEKYYENPNYCKFCNNIIEILPNRPPSKARRMKFCNRSHAASYNNKGIRRHGKNNSEICPECKGKKHYDSKLCYKCKKSNTYKKNMDKPIRDFMCGDHLHPRFKHNRVRKWSKLLMEYWEIEKKCLICGYNKHVEVCHKKPISKFNLDTKMGVVNSKDNLIYLCPNHHWEFDNGLIKL